LIVFTFTLFRFSQLTDSVFVITYFPPPLKQISDGVNPANVTCIEDLEIVLKKSNGNHACLKPASVAKLIVRDWTIHILPDYKNEINNSEIFAIGNYNVETQVVNYFDDIQGYLAKPVDEGQFPGVVMIHE